MFPLLHHGLCVILSAALLLTNGLPMAVQHAHPVGANLSHHTHPAIFAPVASALDSIERRSPARRNMVLAVAPSSITEVTEHIHLLWLGMEFTLPAPKGHQPNTSVTVSAGGLLARLADQGAIDAGAPSAVRLLADFPWVSELFPSLSSRAAQADPPRDFASLPLCDTARHARSGVQLI